MADPLSVTASIAGLVTMADLVFSRVFKYVHAVKGASGEIGALLSEVGALYGVLNNLRLVSGQLEDEAYFPNARMDHIKSCAQTLEKLQTILDKDDTSSGQMAKVQVIKRKLHWPFTSSQVKALLAELDRHKSTLSVALNADSMLGFVHSLSLQGVIRETVDEIRLELKQRHEADVRIALDVKRQKILDSFGSINPNKNQKMSLQLRQSGTGLWLLESPEYIKWAETDCSKLWLYGIPGAGKTVLAATVIEEALRTSNTSQAVAFFYCDFNDPATQKPHLILGSLVQQLAKQDEQSFQKVQTFCDRCNPEYRDNYDYDPIELRDLILGTTSSFDCAAVIVDGLDECGMNAALVTELLASLSLKSGTSNIKALLLSRDEAEIRDHLESYAQLAIGARRSDLKLYVGAEIETRMRKNRLRIRDQSLKDFIMEKLVNEADGMFRWVACQMDYLCELPNDSSRRKALGNLPPTLNATYERILRRVNASNKDIQILVSRALRWIIYEKDQRSCFKTAALCEAISINPGDTERDSDKISDKTEILRWCSSLVRQAADDDYLELAHFTVKEFLQGLGSEESGEFAEFRIGPGHGEEELAKTCLTYLNFQDFNKDIHATDTYRNRWLEDFPFREYAVRYWQLHVRKHMQDAEVFSLAKEFLDPSKRSTLISWAQDVAYLKMVDFGQPQEVYMKATSAIAEASALHYAAIASVPPEICTWLIGSGCDVNRGSPFGTPLQCAIMGFDVFRVFDCGISDTYPLPTTQQQNDVIRCLEEAGADLHRYFKTSIRIHSPLFLSLYYLNRPLAIVLLEHGFMLDEECFILLEKNLDGPDDIYGVIINHVGRKNLHETHMSRLLRLQIAADKDATSKVIANLDETTTDYGPSLRAAAQYGQIQVITEILKRGNVAVDAVDEHDGITALHFAAMKGHLDVAKCLVSYGAEVKNIDYKGRAAVHHAVQGGSSECLEFFLGGARYEIPKDKDDYSVWHLAALAYDKQQLEILARYLTPVPRLNGLRTKTGWSPLLCAASVGSVEGVEWLIDAGCDVMDVASDGSSALHLAVAARSEALDPIRTLLDNGCDVNSRRVNGETSLMISARFGKVDVMDLLISRGGDLEAVDSDGCNIVHHTCFQGSLEIIKRLRYTESDWVKKGTCSFGSQRWTGVSPLHLAAKNWEPGVLEYILDQGLVSDIDAVTDDSETALYIAASFSSAGNVSALLSRRANTNIAHKRGDLPVHIAAEIGDLAVISVFLQHHCDIDVKGQREFLAIRNASIERSNYGPKGTGSTALHYAAWFGYLNLLQIMLDKHPMALFELKATTHPIHLAALNGQSECEEFPQHPWYSRDDIQIPNDLRAANPLHLAAANGHVRTAKCLLEKGAHVDAIDGMSRSPLHHAAATNDTTMVELLLGFGANVLGPLQTFVAKGADLRSQDVFGRTALCYAADHGFLSVVRFIISRGYELALRRCQITDHSPASLILADGSWYELQYLLNLAPSPTIYTDTENNWLTACVRNIHMTSSLLKKFFRRLSEPIVARLLQRPDTRGGTPLYAACTLAHSDQQADLATTLLEAGADLEQEGGDHGTPLMGACATGRFTAVKFLVSRGAKLAYRDKEGGMVSAFEAAKRFPEILRWLLVERLMQGPRRILG
ncbi:MAG: hypothetical protein LQ338_006802 [Usnochroma carphineum]|nr:MAG: hypothetical protein LQ338_006802 [Usnochroma carphineum]